MPSLREMFVCNACKGPLEWRADELACRACGKQVKVAGGLPRFVESDTHENFSIQWKKFWDVQLDSKNGTTESRDRLLNQSGLRPEDFAGKLVLEVGCGAGRFTEVLLGFGARVVAVDYSGAVDACASTNARAREEGRLALGQADVFKLPFPERAFDIVLGYGMLQHTGDPKRALACLWAHVRDGGLLLVDRYELSVKKFLPFKYGLRPLVKRLPPEKVLAAVEKWCEVAVPAQRAALRRLQGDGASKWLRLIINRSPNSVYPLNLEIAGKLDEQMAFRWSVLDTFDQYAPKYDLPCTPRVWRAQLRALPGGEVVGLDTCACGQGNRGVVRRSNL